MNYFVHNNALCESKSIGNGTKIWAFAHILPKAILGINCNVCDGVFIENNVVVGDRVTIKSGVQLWDGINIEDDVFIGPNATFTNDKNPRSKFYQSEPLKTVVRYGASIGANATILPGIEIGEKAMIGAGAVVTKSVPPNAIAIGNPAKITGYVDTNKYEGIYDKMEGSSSEKLLPGGADLIELPLIKDMRGNLSVGEFEKTVPFNPKRYFIVFDVPNREVRGEHAHKECKQFLICIKGSCSAIVDDGKSRIEVLLDRPNKGLYIPPMLWGTQYKYSKDAALLVFTSEYYNTTDYIRNYREFLSLIV